MQIAEKTSPHRVGCVRHLRFSIKECVDSHQGTKQDRCYYVAEVMDLIQPENQQDFHKSYLQKQLTWNYKFKEYFREYRPLAYGKSKSFLTFMLAVA